MVNSSLKGCHIFFFGQHNDWAMEKIPEWVRHASGTTSTTLNNNVTHVLVPSKSWHKQSGIVQQVLDHKKKGHNIQILRYEWLDECFSKGRRASEAKYSWEKADRNVEAQESHQTKLDKSQAGLVKNLFTTSTDDYVDVREQKRIERQQQAEDKARKDAEAAHRDDFEKKRDRLRVSEVAAVFRRGAQRARNEILSDNHHIYMDISGFTYDIVMTKVDTKKNTNERYTLTIFESNTMPHTYAVNCQFAGTGKEKANNIVAAIGATYETALRAFKKIFKEKTRVDWEDRVKAAVERTEKEKGSHGKDQLQEDVANAPYLYHPPLYGARGKIPNPQTLPQVEVDHGNAVIQKSGDRVMIGANGTGPETNPQAEPQRDDGSDFQCFSLEAQDHAREEPKGVTDDAFEDPFDFGKSEDYANFHDPNRFDVRNAKHQSKAEPLRAQNLDQNQLAEHARDNFLQLTRDEPMEVDHTTVGKRREPLDQMPDEVAVKKQKTSGFEEIRSDHYSINASDQEQGRHSRATD